ncbi:MAG TPA: zinc transporter ZupT [Synergistales bacterium]|jgi:ZIP family zinc transporter|nr:zinc transporter ZupT [Synergistales bacterium]HOR53961.1 zinc transporter ZupT [Synergistales bacterium]HPK43074.1 zinc transporter ZupT [Synergistales bacterium]
MNGLFFAFGLTLLAGMATGIGSAIAFFADRTNFRFLSVSTGFSAGVMLYVSFVEIFMEGGRSLGTVFGARGEWMNTAFFFAGMALIGIIDYLIPEEENPHEARTQEETSHLHRDCPRGEVAPPLGEAGEKKLMRTGVFTALAIAIHNFPEGLVTFLAALQNPNLGIVIAVAVALHNIPEGISVSVPIFYATGDRTKAFFYSLLSGMAEPVGALVAYGLIRLVLGGGEFSPAVTGALFTTVAGIMVYISLDELLPLSRAYGKGHDSLIGLVAGMAVMALSLLMM